MGTLFVVSTPIGNLEDITLRATKTLAGVDIILCEDTRRTGQMLTTLSIPHKKLLSYYDEVEDQRIPEIIDELTAGKNIALVSDAGTPLISDPGFRLVRECKKRDIPVVSIPGASAVLAALTSSGLPTDKFTFLGFAPEKIGNRKKLFEAIVQSNVQLASTYILYCAPHKLIETLHDMLAAFGDREVTLARELTKIHEEVITQPISKCLASPNSPKGEYVILFSLI